jgi:ABC-type transporter lipoprotein component MlaA
VGAVDTREQALDITGSIEKTSLDPYATYRSLYQQHRQSVVNELKQGDSPNLSEQPLIGTQNPR